MSASASSKVTANHLSRNAYLYVRQSTLRQLQNNQESTRRQYALQERARALGWSAEQIVVIDCDLGISGASAENREGFQRLVGDVSLSRAGIVLGLEVSRLARNCADWHRLLEICALSDTLILDEDGLYDPAHYNDRLLLGLKGTMSEAELHLLRARLRGGMLAKAERGELRIGLPVGLVYDEERNVVLHPDAQVRDSIGLFFKTFRRTGAACATVKHFNDNGLLFPAPAGQGTQTHEVVWTKLSMSRAVHLLHSPRYAGAYAFGRRRSRKRPGGGFQLVWLPRDQWTALLLDAHPGYITWAEYEENQQRLRDNAQAYGLDNRRYPPREGPALIQGRVVCGRCGRRMTVRYHQRGDQLVPEYMCMKATVQYQQPPCQLMPGATIDEAIGTLLIDKMTPMALELTMAIQDELQGRLDEADKLLRQQVQRAEYEVECARRRYMQVDPTNRLVAASLEADWNNKLRALEETRQHTQSQQEANQARFGASMRERILALAQDFPALWNDPRTPHKERKRMVALLIEDVTLVKTNIITVHVRFRGGASTTLTLPVPLNAWQTRTTHKVVVAKIDALLSHHTDREVADILNEHGYKTGVGADFTATSVQWVRHNHKLKSLAERLRDAGCIPLLEMATLLAISYSQAKRWRRAGKIRATRCNDKDMWLCDPLDKQPDDIRQRAQERRTLGKDNDDAAASPAGGAV